ncbi:unnamed protein product, partial [marine sediment metagenome]
RSWESTKLFYPHIHLIIGFTDKEFELFEHKDKYGKIKLRVSDQDRDIINKYWHSFIDIQGVDNSVGAVEELTKYVTKELNTDKGHKTATISIIS